MNVTDVRHLEDIEDDIETMRDNNNIEMIQMPNSTTLEPLLSESSDDNAANYFSADNNTPELHRIDQKT
jgi:hypothetical protein